MLCMAAVTSAGAAPGGFVPPPAGPSLSPRAHGFMLYLSQPLGGGGGGALHPKIGFRIEQIRMMGNSGAPDAGNPIQHRALVGWQLDGLRNLRGSDMKLELGSRVTYDVTHGAFKPLVPRDSPTFGRAPSSPMFRSATEILPARATPPRDPSPAKSRTVVRASLPQGQM
jgi:hypothetical protein